MNVVLWVRQIGGAQHGEGQGEWARLQERAQKDEVEQAPRPAFAAMAVRQHRQHQVTSLAPQPQTLNLESTLSHFVFKTLGCVRNTATTRSHLYPLSKSSGSTRSPPESAVSYNVPEHRAARCMLRQHCHCYNSSNSIAPWQRYESRALELRAACCGGKPVLYTWSITRPSLASLLSKGRLLCTSHSYSPAAEGVSARKALSFSRGIKCILRCYTQTQIR